MNSFEPWRPRRFGRPGDGGSTLVEVMVASTVLSAVALGLVNAWTVMDRMSFDTLLRQKAVFVLNAEMERIATLSRTTGFAHHPRESTTGYPEVSGLTGGRTRLVYKVDSRGVNFVVKDVATFATSDDNVWLVGTGSGTRNYVWLDRGRSLAARMSWTECEISELAVSRCWGGAPDQVPSLTKPGGDQPYYCSNFDNNISGDRCRLVQLVLEYSFRVNVADGTVVPTAAGGNKTLTLSTIIGRRFFKP